MSFSTISAEPLALQQFAFFQDELEDGLTLHIHLQERERNNKLEQKKESHFSSVSTAFADRYGRQTRPAWPGQEWNLNICVRIEQATGEKHCWLLLTGVLWVTHAVVIAFEIIKPKLEAFLSETQTNSRQKPGKHWNWVFNRSTTYPKYR